MSQEATGSPEGGAGGLGKEDSSGGGETGRRS